MLDRTRPVRACARRLLRELGNALRLAALLAAALAPASAARAQASFADASGVWWFELRGDDAGALILALGTPQQGSVEVEDTPSGEPSFGFSRALGAFFLVEAGQTLDFDSQGHLVGDLALSDPSSGDLLGTLSLARGKPNKTFTKWKARGSVDGGAVAAVKLAGERLPATFPVLSGGDPAGRLSGKGVKSRAFDLEVARDTVLGLPAYDFAGVGPVEIDDVETPDTTLSGRFMLSPRFALFGLLEDSSAFGTGDVNGRLRLGGSAQVPTLELVARAARKLSARGKLTDAVEPVLAVTPSSFDYGALRLNDTRDHDYSVTNVGAGLLSGEVSFLDGVGEQFSVVAGESYVDLAPSDPPHVVTIRFEPTSAGAASEAVLFDVDGGRVGAQIVAVSGEGGIAVLSIVPDSIAFADTDPNQETVVKLDVTNSGDAPLVGTATVTGSTTFTIGLSAAGPWLRMLDYDLDPSEGIEIHVRFRPTIPSTTDETGTIAFTGGGDPTVPLSGGTP